MRIVELFSGIGSQAKAFEKLKIRHQVLNTCEWDIHAIIAYDLIHNGAGLDPRTMRMNRSQLIEVLKNYTLSSDGKNPMPDRTLRSMQEDALRAIYSSILRTNNFANITDLHGAQLPNNIDLLTYSFPCQDLSNVGAFHGYNRGIDRGANNHSGLLWEVERILNERKEQNLDLPQFLLLENVSSLLSERHKSNFDEWKQILCDLGYYNHFYRLNASDFGLPQNRYRLLMISVYIGGNLQVKSNLKNYFNTHNLENENYRKKLNIKELKLQDALKINYNIETYYKEALICQPNDTKSRREIWNDNLQITDERGDIIVNKVATITTKQDRNPNSGNLRLNFNNGKSDFRYLTPRECFILMGFDERDYEAIINNNVQVKRNKFLFTRDKMIRLAGNSIAVNVLEAIFKQMKYIGKHFLVEDNQNRQNL